ncbi:hypothetical protein GCM10011386_42940 [Parapedobacter defluvii]|uniref:Uncharacterized protein n=1 Tax=Parapedobacter defluvii TaxID=2045106 RepID=A0ABQ1MU04_9SPHI|nr:hypothetical protein [Parapedobacter defluvii]GGC46064.1 hypothetical protein GCM10011386_42940 [Parapedobacter defluvii]
MKTPRQDLNFTEEEINMLFGSMAAEDEKIDRLKEYYFKGTTHDKITANLPLRILVGHKGVGKSAIFKIARSEDEKRGVLPILIRPDDIAELGKDTSDVLQTIRNWKNGLLVIIALKTLESIGIKEETSIIKKSLKNTGGIISFITQTLSPLSDKIDLKPTQKQIISAFLTNSKIDIYIDDLDRGWQNRKEDIHRISALLNAVRDLSNENEGLYFKIALRSDVYYLVRTSDESTDKIENNVIWHKWTNHEILAMLIKRIETFYGRNFDEKKALSQEQRHIATFLDNVFEKNFTLYGRWENVPMYRVLMSMVRKRPRDLVMLCTLAARNANDHNMKKIGTLNLKSIFEEYSQGRIQDTINEFQSELKEIQRLLFSMKPTKKEYDEGRGYTFTTSELKSKLSNIISQGSVK